MEGEDGAAAPPSQQQPREELELFENQRFMPLRGWGSRGFLLPTERRRWSVGRDGNRVAPSSSDFPAQSLPPGREWDGPWRVDDGGTGVVDDAASTAAVDTGNGT